MIPDRLHQFAKDRAPLLIPLVLTAGVFAVYLQTAWFEFTNYDEFMMILQNAYVQAGITLEGFIWAFKSYWFEYWHPLTWLSHMLDCQLFGLWPGGHHLVSVLIHAANTILVFAIFRRMTGALPQSAWAAAFFALHPLHVESVAWLAERKDVLSALFFLLSIWAYVRWVEEKQRQPHGKHLEPIRQEAPKGGPGKPVRRGAPFYYRAAIVFYICGLMTKPMVVTLPFVLLLLDLWPLRRFDLGTWRSSLGALVREKVLFFVLTVIGCVVAYVSVDAGGSIIASDRLPWTQRLLTVPVSYVRYLLHIFWPVDLAVVYPPAVLDTWRVVVSMLLLTGITAGAFFIARRAGYVLVGWLVFIGMLVPTIGIIAVSTQPVADRYTYVPAIGLFAAIVWGIYDLVARGRLQRGLAAGVLTAFAVVLFGLSWVQTGIWKDSITLWTHCLRVDPNSTVAHYNLGLALQEKSDDDAALLHYAETLRLDPKHVDAHLNTGAIMLLQKRPAEALVSFRKAVELKPTYGKALANLGTALLEIGDIAEAIQRCEASIKHDTTTPFAYTCLGRAYSAQGNPREAANWFAQALARSPNTAELHYLLGAEYHRSGDFILAAGQLEKARRLAPRWADVRFKLAEVYALMGRGREALEEYRNGLTLQPETPAAQNNLAWLLATCSDPAVRDGAQATQYAARACENTGRKEPVFLGTLAAAYAESGNYAAATRVAEEAIAVALSQGRSNVAAVNENLLRKYRNGQPHREGAGQ